MKADLEKGKAISSTKFQHPSTSSESFRETEAPNIKHQPTCDRSLNIGTWDFSGCWVLELGISRLFESHIRSA
jgi:hypothetical protein